METFSSSSSPIGRSTSIQRTRQAVRDLRHWGVRLTLKQWCSSASDWTSDGLSACVEKQQGTRTSPGSRAEGTLLRDPAWSRPGSNRSRVTVTPSSSGPQSSEVTLLKLGLLQSLLVFDFQWFLIYFLCGNKSHQHPSLICNNYNYLHPHTLTPGGNTGGGACCCDGRGVGPVAELSPTARAEASCAHTHTRSLIRAATQLHVCTFWPNTTTDWSFSTE